MKRLRAALLASTILDQVERLRRCDTGGVALMIGITLPLLIGGAGIGIDYARSSAARTDLQQSADAISQAITGEINACLDRQRTRQTGAIQEDLDTYCLNNPAFVAPLLAKAQGLLDTNYRQRGHSTSPAIVGTPYLDRPTGTYKVSATVSYPCLFMRVLSASCDVGVGANAGVSDAFAQANVLAIKGPPAIELWAKTTGDSLPVRYTAEHGWPAYTFMFAGLAVNGVNINPATGELYGMADDLPCAFPCDPQPIGRMQVGVMDSGDQNRGGKNRQTATMGTDVTFVHELGLQFKQTVPNVPDMEIVGTWIRMRLERRGGKGPYYFDATNLPAGFTIDHETGEIVGNMLYVSPLSYSGTINATVTDARGKVATTWATYNFWYNPQPQEGGVDGGGDGGFGDSGMGGSDCGCGSGDSGTGAGEGCPGGSW